ncbi:MAG TPA: hypothetical protein VFA65_24275 [Bryobacteraceae bacterium]|nr:hypothetical protein [Bryobacteraceae bacterium]
MPIGSPQLILNAPTASIASGSASAATTADAPSGSLVVLSLYGTSTGATISTLVDSNSNSYSLATRSIGTGSYPSIELWYFVNLAADLPIGSTFTATTSGGNWFPNGAAIVSGANGGADQVAAAAQPSGTTFTLTSPSLSVPNEICFATFEYNGTISSYTEDSNWTELTGNPVTSNSGVDFAYRIVNSAAAVSWSPSFSTKVMNTIMATFKASPVPPGTQMIFM